MNINDLNSNELGKFLNVTKNQAEKYKSGFTPISLVNAFKIEQKFKTPIVQWYELIINKTSEIKK